MAGTRRADPETSRRDECARRLSRRFVRDRVASILAFPRLALSDSEHIQRGRRLSHRQALLVANPNRWVRTPRECRLVQLLNQHAGRARTRASTCKERTVRESTSHAHRWAQVMDRSEWEL